MIPMELSQLTSMDIKTTILTIVAIAAAVVVILDLVIKAREVKKPMDQNKRTIDEKLDNDNRRINDLERKIEKFSEGQDMTLQVLFSLLQHEVTGDHVNDMERTLAKLSDYLIKR